MTASRIEPRRISDVQDEAEILREIQVALTGLKFGSVEIAVHNGHVVQIERKEKFRFNSPSHKPS